MSLTWPSAFLIILQSLSVLPCSVHSPTAPELPFLQKALVPPLLATWRVYISRRLNADPTSSPPCRHFDPVTGDRLWHVHITSAIELEGRFGAFDLQMQATGGMIQHRKRPERLTAGIGANGGGVWVDDEAVIRIG